MDLTVAVTMCVYRSAVLGQFKFLYLTKWINRQMRLIRPWDRNRHIRQAPVDGTIEIGRYK